MGGVGTLVTDREEQLAMLRRLARHHEPRGREAGGFDVDAMTPALLDSELKGIAAFRIRVDARTRRELCEKFHKGYISPAKMATQRDDKGAAARGYGIGYGIVAAGFQLAFSILFFTWMGYLADRKLDTRPLFLLLGVGVGLGAGLYAFILKVQAASRTAPPQSGRDERR